MSDVKTLLVGIGAQKAGTTWLATYLLKHPEVYVSPIKEMHYFDAMLRPESAGHWSTDMLDRLKQQVDRLDVIQARQNPRALPSIKALLDRVAMNSDEDYIKYFISRVGSKSVMAEITPSYALLDRVAFSRINLVYSRTKFVFLLRNPVDRLWSMVRFYSKRASTGKSKEYSIDMWKHEKFFERPHVNLHADYQRTIAELHAAVPAQNVHIAFYEHLFQDAGVRGVCDFLGIAFHPGEYERKANASPEAPMPEAFRARALVALAHVYRYVAEAFPDQLPENWRRDMAEMEAVT